MPRNVCYFTGTHGDWGGASRILFNLVRNIDRSRFEPIVMLSREGPVCEELRERNVAWHAWGNHDYRNPIGFAADTLACLRFYRRHRVALVHLNSGCLGWRPAELLAARLARIPVVTHVQWPVTKATPDLLQSTVVLCCSEYLARVSDTGPVPKRAVYDLVDAVKFGSGEPVRQELGLGPEDLVLSFIGRTRRSKGLEVFVELACSLPDPRLRFLVTGQRTGRQTPDSYSPQEVEAMVGRDPRIRYLGFREDIENIYATSDLLVMPSQGEEPCAAVLIETGAAGKPIIASRTGSTPEFIRDGDNGFLVERTDLAALRARAERLIAEPELRARMGRRAREVVEERFVRQPIEAVEGIYEELLASRGL